MSPDMPKLFPVPNTLHAFDIYRMPVRFEEDKTRSRNHYVICVVVYEDGNSGVASNSPATRNGTASETFASRTGTPPDSPTRRPRVADNLFDSNARIYRVTSEH